MPCFAFREPGNQTRCGFVCIGNEPVTIGLYRFEWTPACGWLPVNRDGSERLTPIPASVLAELKRRYPAWNDEKERRRAMEAEAAEPTET